MLRLLVLVRPRSASASRPRPGPPSPGDSCTAVFVLRQILNVEGWNSQAHGEFPRTVTVIFVLKTFVLMIPGSRFRESETQNRVQDLWGPTTDLRFVQTLDWNFRNLN